MNDYKIRLSSLFGPALVWLAGLVLIIVFAPRTVYLNRMVALGFAALCVGTFWALYALYREYDKTGKEWPDFLSRFFPNYPIVEDKNDLMRRLSSFRRSYSDFLAKEYEEENSSLQNDATQLMWHGTALQKKRLREHGLTLEMASERRAYTGGSAGIREKRYFDGRYQVRDVYEEISALRTIKRDGRMIKRIRDREVAHYTLLSANPVGGNKIICPNCGNTTTRENLLDGCDYCRTKFTVEDMKNRVDSFGLRRDFRTSESKKEAVREVMFPWTTLIVMLPLLYFGLIGAFVYTPGMNIFVKLITGILAASLLGLLGWCLKSIFLVLVTPLLLLITALSGRLDRNLIYRRKKEEEQEKAIAEEVRKSDPLFSIQSFFGGVQNKLSAIHYADSPAEINAFSETDLSAFLAKYQDLIDVDCQKMTMDSYRADSSLQRAAVSASIRMLVHSGNRIRVREERLRMTMVKDAACRTQAVCGPSVLRCKGCGASLSLMEGKTCRYCGKELDLKQYDWVIETYEVV